ncbi:Reverse transcriptase (RNA-dependent DNA polymerase) [Roseivivax sp. THAF40]|uniref:antiviral reverse transcriptase Drt2 n=1 Tax=unclassified Roseivivax TaxID=2639302 RepID=UPI001269084A|nr:MULTISPECIES: antiviral reverse transcriptase Drt2 [unclassified Roseivivax]QFS83667.1 Reverse transcriptase (RNA-dependent DNA polymerase) [Roseivivax sp. THAF197b]QFT47475.1 Reverse transcriptase (RNA-dependent DNA polymerase) [Roseivivax sp. THAF40]
MPGFYLPTENEFDPSTDDFVLPAISKERRYKHFDLPLPETERELAIDFTQELEPHRFLPMLGFTDLARRYIRQKGADGKWLRGADGNFIRKVKDKPRPIRFAGHADAAYLQAYAEHLNPSYERALAEDGTAGAVLAYRKGGGTNIHHAKSLFDEIVLRQDCTVVAMDISGFFDCLDHTLLRDEVAGLMGETRLYGHHGTVWKNVTRYSWVETEDLDAVLGKKRNGHGRVCSPADFVQHVRGRKGGLVRKHDQTFGIPQGTPISGLYANIYLRTFDREMMAWVGRYGGSYRRYSDDIAVVLPLGKKVDHVVSVVEKMLADFGLAMSVDKTDHAHFQCGRLISAKAIQYLGFTFDGNTVLIRPSSLDAYRHKMRRGIHAKLVAAKGNEIPSFQVFKREVLSRYTHLGKRRNFLKYAYKAADVMGSKEIRQQVKPHMTWFNRAWEKEIAKVYGGFVVAS